MESDNGAGWRIKGIVDRKFVAPSGKFAALTLAYPGERGEQKTECVAFDSEVIHKIADIGVGETLQATGGFMRSPLTGKARQPVKVDGREVYFEKLKIKAIKVDQTKHPDPPQPDDGAWEGKGAPENSISDPRDGDW